MSNCKQFHRDKTWNKEACWTYLFIMEAKWKSAWWYFEFWRFLVTVQNYAVSGDLMWSSCYLKPSWVFFLIASLRMVIQAKGKHLSQHPCLYVVGLSIQPSQWSSTGLSLGFDLFVVGQEPHTRYRYSLVGTRQSFYSLFPFDLNEDGSIFNLYCCKVLQFTWVQLFA